VSTGGKIRVKSVPDVKFCLVFQCETLSVPVMRRVLGDTLRGVGVDEESVYDILLAATEACTNVLTHGGQQVSGYEVVTSLDPVGCQIEVADEGIGMPSTKSRRMPRLARVARVRRVGRVGRVTSAVRHAQETPVAQLPESGRGLAVMRACVDQVTLDSQPGRGTVVTMHKHISWSQDAPLRQLQKVSLLSTLSPPGPLLGIAFLRRSFLAPQSRQRRGPFGVGGK
jgi:serine/threonine-protein kinase RsbW